MYLARITAGKKNKQKKTKNSGKNQENLMPAYS